MRSLSANAIAKLAQSKGTEPINIVEIDWGVNGSPVSYSDRAVESIPGRILELGQLDNVVDVLNANSSQELPLVLDDTDGSIKAIIDTQDVHQRDVRVYQWFEGLDLSDKFLLFAGKISSPITWSEGERTFRFRVVSQLEDKEFGFSVEEGEFLYIPRTLVGKPWPVIFGKCLDVPALRINQAITGSTLCGVGILSGDDLQEQVPLGGTDCGLGQSLAVMAANVSFLNACASAFSGIDGDQASALIDQANQIRIQMALAAAGRQSQEDCANNVRASKLDAAREDGEGCNPVRILGGEDFPQNTYLTLNINGGLFSGSFDGDLFTIVSRRHPENEDRAEDIYSQISDAQCETDTPAVPYDFQMQVTPGRGDFLNNSVIRRHGLVLCNQSMKSRPSTQQVAQHFWADAGSRVTIAGDEPIYYIASITPGEVLAVKAYKTLEGVRKLVNVPNDLWSVETRDYGTINATLVVTTKPLSSIEGQGWDDDIYVTFESTIGPNTVDILEYIIENWTDLTYDTTSFNAVKTALEPFPSNFAVLDRRNTLDLIKDIAFLARCAVWINNGVFYLKYLPEEPSSDQTISVSDIEFNSVSLDTTPTEDLVTKMIVRWRVSYAEEEEDGPNTIILRHNVKKYGTKVQEFDWFIYNQPDIILKAATFWLIRKSNTWKKLSFRGFLNLLKLETFDTADLDLGARGYVSNDAVKAIVEKADYDSGSNTVAITCLVPIKFGEMSKYKFFWPKTALLTDTFPTPEEITAGLAGGDGIGAEASGLLPIGYTDGISDTGTVFVGGPNVIFRSRADRGDRTPTDQDFVAQEIVDTTVYADLVTEANPDPDLSLNYIDPYKLVTTPSTPQPSSVIDIRTTKIIDSDNPGVESYLDTIIRAIQDSELVVDTEAKFGDGTTTEVFDFMYDDEGGMFGAGTAFLKDD